MKRSLLGISMGTTTEEELLVVVLSRALCVLGLIATGLHAGAPCVRCLCHVRLRCQVCHACKIVHELRRPQGHAAQAVRADLVVRDASAAVDERHRVFSEMWEREGLGAAARARRSKGRRSAEHDVFRRWGEKV